MLEEIFFKVSQVNIVLTLQIIIFISLHKHLWNAKRLIQVSSWGKKGSHSITKFFKLTPKNTKKNYQLLNISQYLFCFLSDILSHFFIEKWFFVLLYSWFNLHIQWNIPFDVVVWALQQSRYGIVPSPPNVPIMTSSPKSLTHFTFLSYLFQTLESCSVLPLSLGYDLPRHTGGQSAFPMQLLFLPYSSGAFPA